MIAASAAASASAAALTDTECYASDETAVEAMCYNETRTEV
jgi:hypothetical protein